MHGPGVGGEHDGRRGVQPARQVRPHHTVGGADAVLDGFGERLPETDGVFVELIDGIGASDIDELRRCPGCV